MPTSATDELVRRYVLHPASDPVRDLIDVHCALQRQTRELEQLVRARAPALAAEELAKARAAGVAYAARALERSPGLEHPQDLWAEIALLEHGAGLYLRCLLRVLDARKGPR